MSKIQDNWNRMAELTSLPNWGNTAQRAEINYRITVQNYYAIHGKLPDDYIPPKGTVPDEEYDVMMSLGLKGALQKSEPEKSVAEHEEGQTTMDDFFDIYDKERSKYYDQ